MKKVSSKNTFGLSDGTRLSNSVIKARSDAAKNQKKEDFIDEHGYLVCSHCWRNDCQPVEASHVISEKVAKDTGRAELCFDLGNLEILGRQHHIGLVEALSEKEREERYIALNE